MVIRVCRDGRRRKGIAALAGAVLLAGSLAACGQSGADDESTYKIGALLGLTGSYSALGTSEQKGAKLFVDTVNAKGGINGHKLELVTADTGSDESKAVNQLRKLVTQEKVVAVIGPSSSGEGIAIKPTTLSLKTPTVVLASSTDIVTPPDQAKYAFKEFPSSRSSLEAQLRYAKEQGKKRIAILAANNGYGQEPMKQLPGMAKQMGLQVVASETFPPTATDMTSQLSSIATKKPDSLLVWAVNPANAIIAKNAQAIQFEPEIFNSPGAATQDYIETGGKATEGTLVQGSKIASPASIESDDFQYDVLKELTDAWEKDNSGLPNQYVANAWDGMLLVQKALETAKPDPSDLDGAREKVRDALESVNDYAGINAVYSFSPQNHGPTGVRGLAVLEVRKGKFTIVKAY